MSRFQRVSGLRRVLGVQRGIGVQYGFGFQYGLGVLGLGALLLGGACSGPPPRTEPKVEAFTRIPTDPRNADPWFQSGQRAAAEARRLVGPTPRARNVILFLGDGMGMSTITAARILAGQQLGAAGEENRLSFEAFPHVALVKTYNTDQQVPDSAGTMTAIASGVKTKAGVLGVGDAIVRGDHRSVTGARVPTLFEEAEAAGLATGIVTTARLTHATPAALYGHTAHRDWEGDGQLPPEAAAAGFPDLARQFVEFAPGDGIDVALGGGRALFLPETTPDPEQPEIMGKRKDGRDLIREWRGSGAQRHTVGTRSELLALQVTPEAQWLGLFNASHMAFSVDRASDPGGEPTLAEMTGAAISLLEARGTGYLLMVEGGRIDHGHHANSAYRALTETLEFSDAVALAHQQTDPSETLIVVTADHGHPLTLAGYVRRGNPILGHAQENTPTGGTQVAKDGSGRPFTSLNYTLGPGHPGATSEQPAGPKRFPHYRSPKLGPLKFEPEVRPNLEGIDTRDSNYLQEAMIPRYSGTHSGEDVPVYATGPGSALFHGGQEQHFLYHALVEAMARTAEE